MRFTLVAALCYSIYSLNLSPMSEKAASLIVVALLIYEVLKLFHGFDEEN